MRIPRILLPAALGFSLALLPSSSVEAAEGFTGRANLFPAFGAPSGATGGATAWFRLRNDRTSIQGLRVWVKGLADAAGATLWIRTPDQQEADEVGDLALAQDEFGDSNGSGYFEVVADSRYGDPSEKLPLGVVSVLKLENAVIEIRVTDSQSVETVALKGRVGDFHFGGLPARGGSPGTRGRTVRMVRPPDPVIPPDDAARGTLRAWRRPGRDGVRMGIAIFATGLTVEETYEVWIEDAAGDLQEVGALDSTGEGLGYWSLDTGNGDTLPDETGEDDVRGLARRRVELRRSGFTDPSLIALFPRFR